MHTLDPVWREMLPSHVCSNPVQYPAEAGWEMCGQWQFVLVMSDSLKKQVGEKQHKTCNYCNCLPFVGTNC